VGRGREGECRKGGEESAHQLFYVAGGCEDFLKTTLTKCSP
jgi:hypothetical protein